MPSMLNTFRLLSDPGRVRLVLLLAQEELTVAELQEILSTGQSTISSQLSQLRQAGLVEDRRIGKSVMYRLTEPRSDSGRRLLEVLQDGAVEVAEAERDTEALNLTLNKRRDRMRAYFDELAGKFGKHYVPGRSWKGLAETLLKLMPPMVIADLGAGEGTFSQLLAQRAERVIAVDNSEKMVEFGADLAAKNRIGNLEYRRGDMEKLPIEDASVDLAFFSQSLHHAQHPDRAVKEAFRILRPGGRIAVLDLVKHHFEEARELYADLWLGFAEVELVGFLKKAGFSRIESTVVHKEEQTPFFETLLVVGDKPRA
ncbi:ArsR/SmtB family transcription factor [Paludibaculum fermentans]|uniref:Metalloregulator ArsR/SmtB family transcription factor n=1 Tax=Paludibaculum fermentans TaxID=1473598 RepID=A0A7S7SKJ4_PALFE|nr:metalloregulator ArsR/SmtB family transcription factor [Paludibaculum fermentans]QOY87501.1 metalloregulator ArsR/SmtB family transcription factor [Paludibaculum fermentans]